MSSFWTWLTEPLGFEFYRRAMSVSAMVGATGGLLSVFVVVRRSTLMVEALSHSLLPGLAVAVLLVGLSPIAALVGGSVSALTVALGALLLARRSSLSQDAAFAVMFLLSLSAGLLMLALGPAHANVEHYLLGNIIGIANVDAYLAYGVCVLAVLTIVSIQRPLALTLFDMDTAVTLGVKTALVQSILISLVVIVLIVAVQAAGILLAVGFLVLPATTLLPFIKSLRVLAISSCALGGFLPPVSLLMAYWLDLPPAPMIIAILSLLAFGAQLPKVLWRR